jgi:hypothetical protein
VGFGRETGFFHDFDSFNNENGQDQRFTHVCRLGHGSRLGKARSLAITDELQNFAAKSRAEQMP